MITDLGSLTLAVIVPSAAEAAVAVNVTAGIAAPDVSAQLTALGSFTPVANLSLADQLSIAQSIVANIQEAITRGLTPPSLALQAEIAADITADLTAKLATVEAQVAIATAIQGLLATGGVRLLRYSGSQNAFGAELAAALGSDGTSCNALVLLTTSGAAWTAMQGVFLTS